MFPALSIYSYLMQFNEDLRQVLTSNPGERFRLYGAFVIDLIVNPQHEGSILGAKGNGFTPMLDRPVRNVDFAAEISDHSSAR